MKRVTLILGLVFGMMFSILSSIEVEAQVLGNKKKMTVGVKTYSYFDTVTKYENEFKDYRGSLDKYNFYNLDESLKGQDICLVYDRKSKEWRLPLTDFEAEGISEKDGEEPLRRKFVPMGVITPAIREKID